MLYSICRIHLVALYRQLVTSLSAACHARGTKGRVAVWSNMRSESLMEPTSYNIEATADSLHRLNIYPDDTGKDQAQSLTNSC